MIQWLIDRSIDCWLVGWSTIELSMDRRLLVAKSIDWSINRKLTDRLVDWSIDLVDQLVDRLVDLVDRLVDQLID